MLACIRLLSCVSSFMFLAIWWTAKTFFTMLACIRLHSCVSSFMFLAIWGPAEALFTMPAFIRFYFCVNSLMFLANWWSAKALIAMLAWIRHHFNCTVNIAEREKENNISGSYLPGSPLQTRLNIFDLHFSEAFRGLNWSRDVIVFIYGEILTVLIIWPASWAGKMNQILFCDWLPCPFGTTRCIPQEKFPQKPCSCLINLLKTGQFGQDGWILASLFFCRVYGPWLSLGPKTRKKRTWSISSHLDRTLG